MTFQLGKTGAAHGCSEKRDLAPAEKFSRGKNATRFAVRKRGLNYHVSGGIRPVAVMPPVYLVPIRQQPPLASRTRFSRVPIPSMLTRTRSPGLR
jgi:hypothetical protein